MLTIGRRIAQARHDVGLRSAERLAEVIGRSGTSVRRYEADLTKPPLDVLERIAEVTGKPLRWFMPEADARDGDIGEALADAELRIQELRRRVEKEEGNLSPSRLMPDGAALELPLLGSVPGGSWREAIEQSGQTVHVPLEWLPASYRRRPLFVLRVVGDSMAGAGIATGSLIVVHPQSEFALGDILVVRNGHGEATLKRFGYDPQRGAMLMPDNPAHEPIAVTDDMHLVGKVIAWWSTAE